MLRRKKSKKPTISKLMKEADRLFSLKVRQKGATKEGIQICYTCKSKNHWKKLHCGHYVSRYYKAARWNEDNARPQCMMCNLWKRGDPINFRMNLIEEIGENRVNAIEKKRYERTHLTVVFLQELIETLK